MAIVEEQGELAVRGGIVDVFPPHRRHPLRLEFWGDDVESIRDFDPASQRSQARARPCRGAAAEGAALDRERVIERGDAIRTLADSEGLPQATVDELIGDLLRGHLPPGVEALAPLLDPDLECVLDYLPEDALVIVDDPEAGLERCWRYAEEMRDELRGAIASGRVVSPPGALALLAPNRSVPDALVARARRAARTTRRGRCRGRSASPQARRAQPRRAAPQPRTDPHATNAHSRR